MLLFSNGDVFVHWKTRREASEQPRAERSLWALDSRPTCVVQAPDKHKDADGHRTEPANTIPLWTLHTYVSQRHGWKQNYHIIQQSHLQIFTQRKWKQDIKRIICTSNPAKLVHSLLNMPLSYSSNYSQDMWICMIHHHVKLSISKIKLTSLE